ncbi:MAG: hypothetical protein NTX56_05370 [Proteobacteria bacterium]|nr:hypothetical protein [Pseudomonadota bacterium]
MNKLLAVLIALGLAIASAAHAESTACDNSCASEHAQCVTRLGDAAVGNCGDSFRLCVQRGDPSRHNAAVLDSVEARTLLASHSAVKVAMACSGNCSSFSSAVTSRKH